MTGRVGREFQGVWGARKAPYDAVISDGSIIATSHRRRERLGSASGRGRIRSGARLLDVSDDLVQRLSGEESVSLRGIVTVAGRELIEEPDRIDRPKLSAKDLDSPLGDLGERLVLHDHDPSSPISSSGLRTFGGPLCTALARLRSRSSQVQK